MLGVPNNNATKVLCNNESVVKNTTCLKSTLNKKYNLLAYHCVRWCVAAKVITFGWIGFKDNLADTMTKRLPVVTRKLLFGNWTY